MMECCVPLAIAIDKVISTCVKPRGKRLDQDIELKAGSRHKIEEVYVVFDLGNHCDITCHYQFIGVIRVT